MNEAIAEMIGNEVAIWSNAVGRDYMDQGILLAYDDPWVKIRKEEGDILCFCVYNVRIVKLLRRLHKPEPKDVLVRPADSEELG